MMLEIIYLCSKIAWVNLDAASCTFLETVSNRQVITLSK